MKIGIVSGYLLAAFMIAGVPTLLTAQGGWAPEEATFIRPRLVVTPTEIEKLRENLLELQPNPSPHFRELYDGVYSHALSATISEDTAETAARRANARAAKNIAFVLSIDRKAEGSYAAAISGEDGAMMRENLLRALATINPSVEGALEYTEWQWRTKELIDYLSAYDMAIGLGLEGAEIDVARDALHRFAGDLYREATREIAGLGFFTLVRNNHALMVCGALGSAALVLNDVESNDPALQPVNWMNAALWWNDDLLWRADDRLSEPDMIAGFAEGPHYLRYASLNVLPFYRGLQNVYPVDSIDVTYRKSLRRVPHPFTDPATGRLAKWATRIIMPDGLLPPIEDTFVDEAFPETALLGDKRYAPIINSPFTTLAASLQSTVDMRANYIATGITPVRHFWYNEQYRDAVIFPAAGNAVVQSSYNSIHQPGGTLQLGILGENGRARVEGGGHNQADAASFYINYSGRQLALDPGYISYDRRDEVSRAEHHNMILVDGEGPDPREVGSDAFIDVVWHGLLGIDGLERYPLGSIRATTEYLGTGIERQFFLVGYSYVMIVDRVRSDEPHAFTWQVHGIDARNGKDPSGASYEVDLRGRETVWTSDSARMVAHVVSPSSVLTYDTIPGVHEIGYNRTGPHTTMRAMTEPSNAAQFLSYISPFVDSTGGLVTSRVNDGSVDLITTREEHVWSLATGSRERRIAGFRGSSIGDTLQTDAQLLGIGPTPNGGAHFDWIIMQEGTYVTGENSPFSADDLPLLRTDTPNSVFTFQDTYFLYVEIERAGTIEIPVEYSHMGLASGENVVSYELIKVQQGLNTLRIKVDGPAKLSFQSGTDVDRFDEAPEHLDLSGTQK